MDLTESGTKSFVFSHRLFVLVNLWECVFGWRRIAQKVVQQVLQTKPSVDRYMAGSLNIIVSVCVYRIFYSATALNWERKGWPKTKALDQKAFIGRWFCSIWEPDADGVQNGDVESGLRGVFNKITIFPFVCVEERQQQQRKKSKNQSRI